MLPKTAAQLGSEYNYCTPSMCRFLARLSELRPDYCRKVQQTWLFFDSPESRDALVKIMSLRKKPGRKSAKKEETL